MDRKSVYVLEAIDLCYDVVNGVDSIIVDDSGVKVRIDRIGCFDSVASAELVIRKLVSCRKEFNVSYADDERYVGFLLTELYLNDALYDEHQCQYSRFESIRSYLPSGELNYFGDVDDRCEKKYVGSDFPDRFVKSGDYAFVLSNNRMTPMLVVDVPYTKTDWKRKFADGVYGDSFDDSGLAYTVESGHIHPFWPYVFPMSCIREYKLSDDCRTRIAESRLKDEMR